MILNRDSSAYKDTTKRIKKHVRFMRTEKSEKEGDKMNEFASKREVEELYTELRNQIGPPSGLLDESNVIY